MNAKQIGLVGLGLAAVGVTVAIFYGQLAHSDATTVPPRPAVSVGGDGGAVGDGNSCVAVGNGAVANCSGAAPTSVGPREDDKAAAASLRREVDPSGPGPWAFNVLFDNGEGLFVRSSPEADGQRLGYREHGGVIYVDCKVVSSFDPAPGLDYGPTWFRVRWPNGKPSDKAFTSSPADPVAGWAWGYYLVPNGHNGAVPVCPA